MNEVTGDKELQQAFDRFGKAVRKVTRRAVNKALTPVAKAVRSEAPVGKTKSVKQAIGKRLNKLSRTAPEISGKVGPGVARKKVRRNGSKAASSPHAHLAVLGTATRFTKRGASRGRMPVNNFVARGFRIATSASAAVLAKTVEEGLSTAIADS